MVSSNLVIQVFFQYCKRPVFKKSSGTYNSECPYCHEGKSAGKKRRFFYIPAEERLYCHNCNVSKKGFDFVKDQTGLSFSEVLALSETQAQTQTLEDVIKSTAVYKKANPLSLPEDSINLFDPNQVSFFKGNEVVKTALEFIKKRRLDTAVNKPRSLWLSLTDYTHKNRLVIPFYSPEKNMKVDFYQSRALFPVDENVAKYLSKANADKGIFNIDKIEPDIDYIFLQEGPIDAMFLRNSVALAGIKPTEEQLERLRKLFPFHTIIYVLDNQWTDKTSWKVTKELLEAGERVFIWPKELIAFKDINELCISQGRDEIRPEVIIKYSYKGIDGLIQFAQVKNENKANIIHSA